METELPLGSTRPVLTSVTSTLTSPAGYPTDDDSINVHTVLIIIMFCIVCFLLLVAVFYALCFHCTLKSLPEDGRPERACSMDREDATFRRSSSSPPPANVI